MIQLIDTPTKVYAITYGTHVTYGISGLFPFQKWWADCIRQKQVYAVKCQVKEEANGSTTDHYSTTVLSLDTLHKPVSASYNLPAIFETEKGQKTHKLRRCISMNKNEMLRAYIYQTYCLAKRYL